MENPLETVAEKGTGAGKAPVQGEGGEAPKDEDTSSDGDAGLASRDGRLSRVSGIAHGPRNNGPAPAWRCQRGRKRNKKRD
jgi:hypothetical protein